MVRSSSPASESLSPATPETLTLIPGLPDDVGALILSFVPYPHHGRLKVTCKSWRLFFSSRTLFTLRRRNPRSLSHLLCIFPLDPSIASPYLFDPSSLAWCALPPLAPNPQLYGLCNFTSVSIGPHLYVLGGSHFDARSFPLHRPLPSASMFRFDFFTNKWVRLAPMLCPRGSFACAVLPNSDQILVAGGGSRHNTFVAGGSRTSSAERYDIEKDEWVALDRLPGFRAGCAGFLARSGGQREFWVMGGYGRSRTISGVLPVDEYYRDAVVLELNNGGKWREVGDMWGEGERARLGKIVVLDDDGDGGQDMPGIYMFDKNDILRYNMATNRWQKESSVPKRIPYNSSVSFVALDGKLYIMTLVNGFDSTETRRTRPHKKPAGALFLQVYNPRNKTWSSFTTKVPFFHPLDLRTAVMCTVQL